MTTIHKAEGRLVRSEMSAWYDHSYVLYPFSGRFDYARMHEAMRKGMRFPEFNSIGSIEEVGPGYIEVEHIYHIGD